MACFPKIDSPCPLSAEQLATLGTDCSQCGHRVHRLDAMSPAERRALVRGSAGPLCVSYRVPAGLAALALSLAMPAMAAGDAFELRDPPSRSVLAQDDDAAPQSSLPGTVKLASPECGEDELSIIVVGGISAPDAAEWLDDEPSDLPELPVIREAAS